ncbi:MAG: hypothetical protein ABSD47_04685 [Candidatus Methylomirabilota bacterium]
MRKLLAVTLVSSLILAWLPGAALAGDGHAVRDRWAGAAIGAGMVALGGILYNYNVFQGNSVAAAPTVVTTPPAVVYSPPPPVVYAPPAVEYRTWVPGHYEDRWVPTTQAQRVWVAGHYENRWWVPGHWRDRIRNGRYWTRIWVEGYWR